MKKILQLIPTLFFVLSVSASPIEDHLLKELRSQYNGTFPTLTDGTVRSETLEDGRLLLEVDGDLAKLMLYNMSEAQDRILYARFQSTKPVNGKPPVEKPSAYNYFIRDGKNILCGLGSFDLKQDPLPTFKCRMILDKEGQMLPFSDRPTHDAVTKFNDFFKEGISSADSPAGGDSISRNWGPAHSFRFYVSGEAALKMFNLMTGSKVVETTNTNSVTRESSNLRCKRLTDLYTGSQFRCETLFGFSGEANLHN